MARSRKRKRQQQSAAGKAAPEMPVEVRLPTDLQEQFANAGLELARIALTQRRWKSAFEFAEAARGADAAAADALMAEASARMARHCTLCGRFADAMAWSERAVKLRPNNGDYQQRRALIKHAAAAALASYSVPAFADTVGPTKGSWWDTDLLGRVRGWDGGTATVPTPTIMGDIAREAVDDVYAVGIYQPWHVGGPTPTFTRYVRELKPHGETVSYAATLMRQGLVSETDWIEQVDAIVPMATSMRSFEHRGFELTEELAAELGMRLCLPVIDVFEIDPEAEATHRASGYRDRARMLESSLTVKHGHSAVLSSAEAVLIVDDVVTYGSTFEACALRLKDLFGIRRIYGAALAYTQTPEREAKALAELGVAE